ncbi:MAG TPA: hypothetical protein VGP03_08075 [Pseudonocardiaceae bacterium]|jgi:hypothetical protein|nr:hypothetical protein [Pseudonocardiaceae bacterium]
MPDLSCERLRAFDAELALDVLPARDRAEALAHLHRCPGCREHVCGLVVVADRLLDLLPGSEPPAGFEKRALMGFRPRKRRRRAWIAAAVLALVFGAGGWGANELFRQSQQATLKAEASLITATLTTDRKDVGEVFVHVGARSWVYTAVDEDRTSGMVRCEIRQRDGTLVPAGYFTLDKGYGYWGAPVWVDPRTLAGFRVLRTDGTVLGDAAFDQ